MCKYLMLIYLAAIALSCNQQQDNKAKVTVTEDTIPAVPPVENPVISEEQTGDTLVLSQPNDKGNYTATGTIDSLHPNIFVKFTNQGTGHLKAEVSPAVGEGNIRFNQIILPDKSSDGPFGKNISYDLKQSGEYLLVIGASLMAEDRYRGKFKVKVHISAKPE